MKKIIAMLLTLALMLCGVSAFAEAPAGEVILSPDGILSIQAPSASWHALSVADAWFAIGNETDTITINHLSNGEALPASMVANDRYGAVYQANFSTPNEVFCVMGRAVREEDLETLIQAIGSIKILKKNTKAAASVNDPFAGTGYSLRPINRVYTCTSDPLILRTSWTYLSAEAGRLQYGQAVMVNGAVTRNGEDIGWYQLQFNNGIAYGPSQYFSPASANSGTGAAGAGVPTGGTSSSNTQIQQQSEAAASQPFMVYPMAGGAVTIWRQANGQYVDGNGRTYTQTPKGLYVCDQTEVTYSADPNYWTQQQSEEAASQAFTVYPMAGGEVRIQRQNGQYVDDYGRTYTQTPKGLYVCDQTNVTYSADPNYWAQQQEEDELEQHARDLGDDTPDDVQNEEDELEQHARDLGDDKPDDVQNEEDELEQHAQDLGDDEPSHD